MSIVNPLRSLKRGLELIEWVNTVVNKQGRTYNGGWNIIDRFGNMNGRKLDFVSNKTTLYYTVNNYMYFKLKICTNK